MGSVTVKQFQQLKKLMQLATSPADAEALGALRKANAMLAAAGVDWERVLSRCVTVEHAVEEAPDDGDDLIDADHVERALEAVEKTAKGSFAKFIASLREQWDEKGQLSGRQLEVLFRAEGRARR